MTTVEIDRIKEKFSELNFNQEIAPYSDREIFVEGWFTLDELELLVAIIKTRGE